MSEKAEANTRQLDLLVKYGDDMRFLRRSSLTLAAAAKGCPIVTTIVVFLFFLAFNVVEGKLEVLIFGERFEHFLDPLFICAFIAYSAYAVYGCAVHNSRTKTSI